MDNTPMGNASLQLEWFGGNAAAMDACNAIFRLSHIWDDLIDKDAPVSDAKINEAFVTALVYLPTNPFYRAIQLDIAPMWLSIVSAYETANQYERDKEPFGLELAYMLRCAIGHIVAYAIHVCVGPEKTREFAPMMWKTIVNERFEEYRKEHLNVDPQ